MPIVPEELLRYRAEHETDDSSCGGRMTANECVPGVRNNIFPDVTNDERETGVVRYRKLFFKVANADNKVLRNAKIFLSKPSSAGDFITIIPANQTNTVGDLTGTEREYGCAYLASDVAAGATQLVVTLEDETLNIFFDTDIIWISDGNKQEFHRLQSAVKSGLQVTLTLASGEQLANAYSASTTVVASVYDCGDIETAWDNWLENSSSGSYNEEDYPPQLDNIGTIEQTWTLTFQDAETFEISGDTVGNVGSGNINNDCSPMNPDFGRPYFTLSALGWQGTWQANDILSFRTHPAARAVFLKQTVPAGTASAESSFETAISGESS